jgi:murein tripeptide amidase MpaA
MPTRALQFATALTLCGLPLLSCAGTVATTTNDPLSTFAQRTQFTQTGRYDEVEALCQRFQKSYPKAVRCFEFGRTPEGRPMLALAATLSGVGLTPDKVQQAQLPVLLIQGGIHAGEIDGKDAGFLALRTLLQQTGPQALLRKQVLLFVPVFNVDGHERFGRWNRPNQRGPEQMGWRTTAQNFNLNRDYVKADAPEMQAMLKLVNQWDPLAYIDLHVTNGAKFEHDISIQVEPTRSGDEGLRSAGLALRDNVISALEKSGSLPRPFYFSFAKEDDPSSGFIDTMPTPRFSGGYFLFRNRFSMLVETHAWKDYPTRVGITKNTIMAVVQQIAQHGRAWQESTRQADRRTANLAGKNVTLTYKTTEKSRQIEFFGYEYSHHISAISGVSVIQYDETKPKRMMVPLRDEIVPDLQVTAPAAGYLVPPAHAPMVAQKLQQHGIAFQRLNTSLPSQMVEAFRADSMEFANRSFEGRQRLAQTGNWKIEQRGFAAGGLFVPIAQAKARLLMILLEPQNPDSLVAWGSFNQAYEKKEYMEAYVVEEVATKELAENPVLAQAFREKLANDPKFAADPEARMTFFARRHSSWDTQYQLYPILRTDTAPKSLMKAKLGLQQ